MSEGQGNLIKAKGKSRTPERILFMAMNAAEIKNNARQMTIAALMPVLEANDAVKFADASFAILQTIEGQEVWTEVSIKSKAYKPTKVSPAFDPYAAAEVWQEEKRISAEKKAEKESEKAKKIVAKNS